MLFIIQLLSILAARSSAGDNELVLEFLNPNWNTCGSKQLSKCIPWSEWTQERNLWIIKIFPCLNLHDVGQAGGGKYVNSSLPPTYR